MKTLYGFLFQVFILSISVQLTVKKRLIDMKLQDMKCCGIKSNLMKKAGTKYVELTGQVIKVVTVFLITKI